MVTGSVHFLSGCWHEAYLSSLPCEPLHGASYVTATGFSQSKWASERASESEYYLRWKVQHFYNLMSEVTSHYVCCILFVRSKSLSPAHMSGDYQDYSSLSTGGGVVGDHHRGCIPRRPSQHFAPYLAIALAYYRVCFSYKQAFHFILFCTVVLIP